VDLKETPVLVACAGGDAHIPLAFVEQSAATLATFNAAVTKQIFPGNAHTVFPDEVHWLREQVAGWA
jgi:predicted esterase